jgi:hypothetical protein
MAPAVGTLQTLPVSDPQETLKDTVGKVAGFSLHAGLGGQSGSTQEAEAAVPLHKPPGGRGETDLAHPLTETPLSFEDTVLRWHCACYPNLNSLR